MVKEAVEEVEVEIAAKAAVEDKKRVKMRSIKIHMTKVKENEEKDQVSLIFNVIVVKSSVIMQRNVIIMRSKMMKKDEGGDGVVLLASKEDNPNNDLI
jgi:hypothetical protein